MNKHKLIIELIEERIKELECSVKYNDFGEKNNNILQLEKTKHLKYRIKEKLKAKKQLKEYKELLKEINRDEYKKEDMKMDEKIRNLLKTIVYQADDARTKTIIDSNTLQEKECKEITFYISTKAVEDIRSYLKEEENGI